MLLYLVGELPSNGRRAADVAEAEVAVAVAAVAAVSFPNFRDNSANTLLVY